jgi:hypothetical protein
MASALKRKPLPKPSPESDPRYRRVMEQLRIGAARTKAHPPASRKAADAAKAAKGPRNERLAAGKSKQVDKIQAAKEGKPEQKSFLTILRAEIARTMPKNLKETENFGETAQQMKGGLKANVSQQKETSTHDVSAASKEPPSPSGTAKVEKQLPVERTPSVPRVNATEGMPAPKGDAEVSLQDSKEDVDAQMKDAQVTPTSLKNANDPRFSAVVDAKDQVAKNADAGPAKYRATENATIAGTAATAAARMRVGAAAMIGVRRNGDGKVLTRQQLQKAKDEARRKEVVDRIESIYEQTQKLVEFRLAAIDPEVNRLFDLGVDAALKAMTKHVNAKIRAYKIDRYSSFFGPVYWIKDQFKDLPEEVNVYYEEGSAIFSDKMDALLVRVANVVERRLADAKREVAIGQARIKVYVDGLDPGLRKIGEQAQADVGERFRDLESGIEAKKNALAESLAQKYKEGFDKANEALQAIRDANKGLVAAFVEKLVAAVKAIAAITSLLLSILLEGLATIHLIIAHPIRFVGNLISAVKGGVSAFFEHLPEHLSRGFNKWLFGNLPPGVEIPTELSLPSIFKLVMGVLGLTPEALRAKAVTLIGTRNVELIDEVTRRVHLLIQRGPAAMWEEVKGDLATLEPDVVGAIKTWLKETIIGRAVTKILMMFAPAGGIVQAVITIYNIIMFVVERAAEIAKFVQSVMRSIHAIATGNVSVAIEKIQSTLGDTIPIAIGFFARLIGLGGISQKIHGFVNNVKGKVDRAINKALAKIVAVVKKVGGNVKAAAKALLAWWKRETRFAAGGESHRLFFTGSAKSAALRVASDEMSLRDFLGQARKDGKDPKTIHAIERLQTQIENLRANRTPATPDAEAPGDSVINAHFDQIARLLPKLFSGSQWGTKTNPLLILEYPKKSASLYRTIYLGPRVNGALKQEVLKKDYPRKPGPVKPGFDLKAPIEPTPKALDAWIANGGTVHEYRPFQIVKWPDRGTHGGVTDLGVEARFLAQAGTLFKYLRGQTPGGRKLNDALKKFGYYGREAGENSDGDHILEAQLIGKDRADVIGNMWPLDKKENRHGQNLHQQAKVAVASPPPSFSNLEDAVSSKDPNKADTLYLMIKRTRS